MQERVVELVGNKGEDILSGTFHSVCAKLLRIDCDKLGYDKNFTICDRSDQEKMLRGISSRTWDIQTGLSPAIWRRISVT